MVIAVLIGIVIGFVVFAYTPIGNRYEIKPSAKGQVFKYDKWTGQTYKTARRIKKDGSCCVTYYEDVLEK